MNRKELFARIDASSITDDTFDINIASNDNDHVTKTVEFTKLTADSMGELEEKIDELAREELNKHSFSRTSNVGYELVKDEPDPSSPPVSITIGFSVVEPELSNNV